MKNTNKSTYITINKPALLIMLAGLIIAGFVLLPQLSNAKNDFQSIKNIDLSLLALASFFTFSTYVAAAFTLKYLAIKKLYFNRTLIVQLASGFATKLAPAGIGGFALNTRYLTKQNHNVVEASSVMAINALLGFIGHVIILLTTLLFAKETLRQTIAVSFMPQIYLLLILFICITLLTIYFVKNLRKMLKKTIKQIKNLLVLFYHKPKHLTFSFIGALGVTLFYTLALFLCALALGIHLNFLESLLVFTACAIGASITPTPGGLGGAEAALAATLIAVGVETTAALSLAITFRFITYWLPILPGLLFFNIALHRNYI